METQALEVVLFLFTFFGTPVLLQDMADVCGEVLDTEFFKTTVLFAVIFAKCRNLLMTSAFLAIYAVIRLLLIYSKCKPSQRKLYALSSLSSPLVFL